MNNILGNKIGEGSYGEIYINKKDPENTVIKVFKKKKKRIINFYTTKFIKLTQNHPNLTHLYSFEIYDDKYLLILEKLNGHDLFNIINIKYLPDPIFEINYSNTCNILIINKLKRKFDEYMGYTEKILSNKSHQKIKKIIKQLLDAVKYLHKNNIIHNDIKPENIRLLNNGNIKLYDYTLSHKINYKEKKISGTSNFIAPEKYLNYDNNITYYNEKVDIWSLGCVFYSCVESKLIHNYKSHDYFKFWKNNPNFNIINKLNKKLWDKQSIKILKSMLIINPNQRLSANDILNLF